MQIPGLNLLYGEPPPIDANNDTLPSSSTTWSTPVTFADNHKAETLQVPTPPSGILDDHYIDGAGVESGISNGESSNDLATNSKSEMITLDADPLDIALAQNSDMSSPESDAEDQPDDSDNESASPSESDNERLSDILDTAQFGSLEGLDDEGDDLEDGAATQTTSVRTKNEAVEDFGPVDLPNVSINENAVIERLGTTEKIMGTVAIVRAHTGGEYRVLDEGAVVVTETRNVVGVISETFGPVKQPHYVVRLAENQVRIEPNLVDKTLFYIPDRASFVFTRSLRGTKGSDASNIYDEEINEEEREFSDDEAELEHRRSLKRKRGQEKKNNAAHDRPPHRQSTSVDSNQDLTYRPLSRPPTHNMPSVRFSPPPRAPDLMRNRRDFYTQQPPRHDQSFANSSRHSPVQLFPQQSQLPYNGQFSSYPVMPAGHNSDGYLGDHNYTSLPPGAYVNPAFFNRTTDANLPVRTPNISSEVQRQMENILSNFRPPAQ